MENQTEDNVLGCVLGSDVMCIYEDRKKYIKNSCDLQI